VVGQVLPIPATRGVYHRIGESPDTSDRTDKTFLCCSKAFDSVLHSLLLDQLQSYDNRLRSYALVVGTVLYSRVAHLAAWVLMKLSAPQGSLLGRFCLFW